MLKDFAYQLNMLIRSHVQSAVGSLVLTAQCFVVLFSCAAAVDPVVPVPTPVPPASISNQVSTTVTTNAPIADAAAGKFMNTCAGCHSLFGIKLTGPELSHVSAWPADQLSQAIKRMEVKVGPLKETDISLLSGLLRDLKVRDRLKAEEARIQAQFMAKMDPPNALLGKQLFLGQAALKNGGLGCVACHSVAGQGGNLGPDLSGIFAKMGETPLISSIENASFKVMGPHYRTRPVTKQEAMHLARYFSALDPKSALAGAAPFVPIGVGGALAMLAGLTFYYRNQRTGRDQKLQPRRK